ncbi:MAG: ISKra4 family transposase, partial [Thermoanaerobaculia bacterium]
MVGFLKSSEAGELTESQLERAVGERIRELARRLIQAHVEERGPGDAACEVRGSDGVVRERERVHERGVQTIFGEVRVSRVGYGADGVRGLHPLDAELNLPEELYSLEVRRRAAEEAAKQSFDETVASLERQTGTVVGKRQVEELVQRAAVDFDAFYERRSANLQQQEGTGSILVISADGKGVVMLPRDLREATRKAAQKASHKLEKRLSKGEKRDRKRMATVATVYTVAPHERAPEDVVRSMAPHNEAQPRPRPRPENKRVWASLEKSAEEVIAEAFREASSRDPDRKKAWVALVDGNKPQLAILKAEARKHKVRLTIVVDIMHVAEYLWGASLAFHAEASKQREEWVSERLLGVLSGRASLVAGGMRRSATRRRLDENEREAVDDCADYLLDYKSYLRYDRYLAKGFPIATGVIEGACRHLVCDRMDGGARWSLRGAEAVLRLRSLRSSGDFDEYWTYHEAQEYQRNHVARYAGHKVPSLC